MNPKYARQSIEVIADTEARTRSVTAALPPAQIINLRVTYADTGKPVPHAPLGVFASHGRARAIDTAETDAEGRARINSWPADKLYHIDAYPPEGEPYLIASGGIDWPKGALEQSLALALPRGVLLHGKLNEADTGRPVPGAIVAFIPHDESQAGFNLKVSARTAADGSFRLGAKPTSGCLFFRVPGDDYRFEVIGYPSILQGRTGGHREYTHAHVVLDLKPGLIDREVSAVVRRGATVAGRVVGPDGQPVRDALMFSPAILDPGPGSVVPWSARYPGKVRDGRFAIHGLGPDAEVPVFFLEPKAKLGTVVQLSGKPAVDGPLTVRLEPCGTAKGRLVGPDGKPLAKPISRLSFRMVVTPWSVGRPDAAGMLQSELAPLSTMDPVNYPKDPAPDADGRILLPALIPGATYTLRPSLAGAGRPARAVEKEFTVRPGETLDLGDISVDQP